MRTDDVVWTGPPADDDGPYIPIYSAKPFGSFELVVLSAKLVGVNTHYSEGRTVPCTKVSGDCICLRTKVSIRWKGYLACWEPKFDRVCLAELTVDSARHANISLVDNGLNLRGAIIRLRRLGKAKNAPVRVEFKAATADLSQLPAEPDVHTALIRIWEGKGPPRPS